MAFLVKNKKSAGKFYAVRRGVKAGIYNSWKEASEQVHRYPKCEYKSFSSFSEAKRYMSGNSNDAQYGFSYNKTPLNYAPPVKRDDFLDPNLYDHYRGDIYIERGNGDRKIGYYPVEDRCDARRYIFKSWDTVTAYLKYRKLISGNKSEKSLLTFKRFDDLQTSKNYLERDDPKLENKYSQKFFLERLYAFQSYQFFIHKVTIYCDGSFMNGRMGYGLHFEHAPDSVDQLTNDPRVTLANVNNEHIVSSYNMTDYECLTDCYGTVPASPSTNRSTNNIAELYALKKALEKIAEFYMENNENCCLLDVSILTDSGYALNAVQRYVFNKEQMQYDDMPNEEHIVPVVKQYLQLKNFYRKKKQLSLFNLSWNPGHTGIKGNELADKYAKMGANSESQEEENTVF